MTVKAVEYNNDHLHEVIAFPSSEHGMGESGDDNAQWPAVLRPNRLDSSCKNPSELSAGIAQV